MRSVIACFAIVLLALLVTAPARADFSVCNQTLDVVNVAIGHTVGETFRTEGWWTIGSNQCARVIREDLTTRYVYVFADDVFGQPLLQGTTSMCLGPSKFSIDGVDSCWARGHKAADFLEVDTKSLSNWTFFLTEPSG